MEKADIISMIEKHCPKNERVQFLLCGSSINNPRARDIDIMIYTCHDLQSFFQEIVEKFENYTVIKKEYIKIWNMYSLKILKNNEVISFHIVSFNELMDLVYRKGEIEIYTKINLFSLSMKLPTVYRKWIIETVHLAGDRRLKEQLEQVLIHCKMPTAAIGNILRKRIMNTINYYFEKSDSDLFSGIIVAQIFNDIVLYCYAKNNMYYGTLKYLESDLKAFKNDVELANKSIELFCSINRESSEDIVIQLHQIKKLL